VSQGDGAEIARLIDTAYGKPVHGGAEGEEKLATERYAPSLSGRVMALSVSSLPTAGVTPTDVKPSGAQLLVSVPSADP
jgi:hypothetical protein